MKRYRLLAVLAALATFGILIGLGRADNNTLDHSTYFQNATNGAKVTSTGEAYVSEYSKDRDNWRVYPNIINNQLNATTAGVDSCQPQDTHDMRQLALVLYGQFDSLSTVVRLAVEIRGHYSTATDSGSTYPWIRWPVRATFNGTTDVDSLGQMYVGTYAVAQLTSANQPFVGGGCWPGEFMVKFSISQRDSVASGAGKYGAAPYGMWIQLVDQGGNWFQAPYTSVRIRVLNGVRSRFRIRADLVGRSL